MLSSHYVISMITKHMDVIILMICNSLLSFSLLLLKQFFLNFLKIIIMWYLTCIFRASNSNNSITYQVINIDITTVTVRVLDQFGYYHLENSLFTLILCKTQAPSSYFLKKVFAHDLTHCSVHQDFYYFLWIFMRFCKRHNHSKSFVT